MSQSDRESVLEGQADSERLTRGRFVMFEPVANCLHALGEMRLVNVAIGKHLPPRRRFLRTFHPAIVANTASLPAKSRTVDFRRHRAFLDLEQQFGKIAGIATFHFLLRALRWLAESGVGLTLAYTFDRQRMKRTALLPSQAHFARNRPAAVGWPACVSRR